MVEAASEEAVRKHAEHIAGTIENVLGMGATTG
jgi:hypothetical protein